MATLSCAHRCAARAKGTRRWLLAGAGAAVVAVALAPPLARLANGELFVAHMLQHLLLLLVAPLLLVAALPPSATTRALQTPLLRPLNSLLALAPLTWLSGIGAMWFWHQPAACTAALTHPAVAVVRDASFLLAGACFWWPIAGAVQQHRVRGPLGMAYLVSACVGCTVLGVAVTFSPSAPCPLFAQTQPSLPLTESLRRGGFTPRLDQQLGGLLMWVAPCLLYMAMSVSVLRRWHEVPSPAAEEGS
jgi:cytochrome c oxidase assembly factor CtaG